MEPLRNDSGVTLDDLYERGLGRSQIAHMLGVPISQVPHWRSDRVLGSTAQVGLNGLGEFLAALDAAGIGDPAAWLENYLEGLPPGYRVQPYKHYTKDTAQILLDLATGRRDVIAALDALRANWRTELYSAYDIQAGEDGHAVIVPRPTTA